MLIYYEGNTGLLRAKGITNEQTGTPVTAGVSVTALIKDSGGATVTGSAVTLTNENAAGDWSAPLPSDLALVEGQIYEVYLTIDGGSTTARSVIRAPLKRLPRRQLA